MATSEKGSETKETSLREYEMLSAEEETPPWALALFNKVKYLSWHFISICL